MKAERIREEEKNRLSVDEELLRGVFAETDWAVCKSTNLSDEGVQADEVFHRA
jgi:hypothetical protein